MEVGWKDSCGRLRALNQLVDLVADHLATLDLTRRGGKRPRAIRLEPPRQFVYLAGMSDSFPPEVKEFLGQNIHSVAQLEVLLMLRAVPERRWSADDVAKILYVQPHMAKNMLLDLVQRGFVVQLEACFRYQPANEVVAVVEHVAQLYRRLREERRSATALERPLLFRADGGKHHALCRCRPCAERGSVAVAQDSRSGGPGGLALRADLGFQVMSHLSVAETLPMQQFLTGAMAMACWTAMLFFLRFWRESKDRLFIMFAMAFLLLGLTRLGVAMSHEPSEGYTYLYWVRLAAFILILIAIVDKNRR